MGYLHSFESFGALDGPGVRCVVFLQGCPLRCIYCHNPDTWTPDKGQNLSPHELLKKVVRYKPYFGENGGVTVSGGEPLLQAEFVTEFFKLCKKEHIHTALDTSGIGDREQAAKLLDYTDLVIQDIKFTSEQAYRTYTGGSLKEVLAFLALVEEKNKPLWVRHVVVPGLTDSDENLRALAGILSGRKGIEKMEFLPFRKLCIEKYKELNLPFALANTPETDEAFCEQYLARFNEIYHP